MIFGRKRQAPESVDVEAPDVEISEDVVEDEAELLQGETPAELTDDEPITVEAPGDWRADGPFDIEEVDLEADQVNRLDLGSLIVTPWEGMGLQLQVQEGSKQIHAALAVWENSGIELTLLAAPTSGGLAAELREDLLEEAEQAGGNAVVATGPFGPEVRRVLPAEGPNGEQLFQVARIWFAEGPRWLLRGMLMGEVGLTEGEEPAAKPFVEFFRNVVVRRGDRPMVPGEVIVMKLPQGIGE
ncbi:MAG: DUF3710 domain-containing protein [Micropruina sp.]|nr:DUF3710 domain-containing protein [Micropruina sp.]